MAEHPTWSVGNRNPPISEEILQSDNETPVNLTGATVRFKMRAVGSATLKVDQPATVDAPTLGQVHYNWAAVDVDTAGEYLVWWEVTAAGLTQDLREAIIVFEPHSSGAYLELEQAKSALDLDYDGSDTQLAKAIVAASRVVDEMTGTRFYTTTSDEVRYYTPTSVYVLSVDDLNAVTEVAVDTTGGTDFGAVWTLNTDFTLEPFNAALDGEPWKQIRIGGRTSRGFPCYPRSVRVTGKFGWPTVPDAIKVATQIITTQYLIQQKSAPLGIVTAFDGTAVRVSSFGPRVTDLLAPYTRTVRVA